MENYAYADSLTHIPGETHLFLLRLARSLDPAQPLARPPAHDPKNEECGGRGSMRRIA